MLVLVRVVGVASLFSTVAVAASIGAEYGALPAPDSFVAIPTWLWGFMLLVGGGALGWIITVERRLVKFETLMERIVSTLDTLRCTHSECNRDGE